MPKNKIIDENSEFYAKNLLEETLPHIFHDLKKGEKPDLYQGDLYGIEVTKLGFSKDLKVTKIWNLNAGREKSSINERDLSTLDQLNPQYNDSGELISIDPPEDWRSGPINVVEKIRKKVERLNSKDFNASFRYNGLFIVYTDCSYNISIEEIIHTFNAVQALAAKKFDFLVIWDYFNLHFYCNSGILSYERLLSVKEKAIEDYHKFEKSKTSK